MNKGLLAKGNDTNPPEIAPDISKGKAIAGSASAVVIGGGFSALVVCVGAFVVMVVLCVLWGIGIAISAV